MKMIKHIYIAAGLVVSMLFLHACGTNKTEDKSVSEVKTGSNKTQSVEVEKPQQRSFVAEVLITGTARPNQQVTIYAMESGYVQNMRKDIGDAVSKGDIIATLANPNLKRQLEEKKAKLEARKSTYQRLKSSYEKTPAITPLKILEDAKSEYLTALSAFNNVQDRLSFMQIKAPFGGRITKRLVDNGALVQSGLTEDNPQGIVELQQTSPIRLTVDLPESDIAAIDKGMEVLVTFPELPGKSFKAKVSRTAGALDPASKTMKIEIDISNPKGTIKSGMYAKALMQISSRDRVSSLPVTAQWMYQNQPFVLVVKDNKVDRIALRKGLSNNDYFEVLNPEITENTLVIIQGKGLVQQGQIVNPVLKSK
jgi:RND family efflux transporter MFP subunit